MRNKAKINNNSLWIVLTIVGFPLWFPLLIALIAVTVSIYVAVWSIIVSLFAVVFAFGVSGVSGLVGGAVFCFTQGPAYGLAVLGAALICFGLLLFTVKPVINMAKWLVLLTQKAFKGIKIIIYRQNRRQNMKNGKIFIIATIILLIGIVLVVGAFALNDFRFDGLNSESLEEKNYTFAEKSDKLIIVDDNSEISIKLSDTNAYNVSCYDGEHHNYEVSQETERFLSKRISQMVEHIFSFSFGSADLV